MEVFFSLTVPFFAVIGLGYLAGTRRLIPPAGIPHLNTFVFYFAMPALIVGALAKQPVSVLLDGTFLAAWISAGGLLFALGALGARFAGMTGLANAAISGQASAVGNVGFLALPLVLVAFGPGGIGPVAAALIIDLVVLIPLSIGLIEVSRGGTELSATAKRVARGMVFNPFLVSIVAGVLLSATGIGIPSVLERFVAFLGGAAGPTALFALGLSLAGRRLRGDLPGIFLMSLLKLIVHPVVAYLMLSGFGLSAEKVAVGTVVAAMPIAGNVFVIAEQYGVGAKRVSAAILVSTVIAVVTVALALSFATGLIGV